MRRFGHGAPNAGAPDEVDPLLDRFMPAYEVVERHKVRVRPPAEITLTAAYEQNLLGSPVAFSARSVRSVGTRMWRQRLAWRIRAAWRADRVGIKCQASSGPTCGTGEALPRGCRYKM